MKKYKIPKTKVFEYDVGFDPTPSRDLGTPVVVRVELCCNKLSFYLVYVDVNTFKMTEDKFRQEYPEQYRQFQKDYSQYTQRSKQNDQERI